MLTWIRKQAEMTRPCHVQNTKTLAWPIERIGAWPRGVYIGTRRDEQCRQGWNNQDSKEIHRVRRATEEDKS